VVRRRGDESFCDNEFRKGGDWKEVEELINGDSRMKRKRSMGKRDKMKK
jgi:hypothetical protein